MILIFDAVGLAGYDAAEGIELWRYDWKTDNDINVSQPIVLSGDRVFITSGYGHGCALLRVSQTNGQFSVKEVWPNTPNPSLHCKFSNPVLFEDHIYGLDDGRLVCLDVATGKKKWKDKDYGHGQMLLAGDKLVILSESGDLAVVAADPKAFHELGKVKALTGEKTWNYPAMVGKRVFVRNHEEMACYDLE
jgi:outer membrane protein assembly factor BamB